MAGKATSAAPPSYDADAIAPPENEMEGEDEADDEPTSMPPRWKGRRRRQTRLTRTSR